MPIWTHNKPLPVKDADNNLLEVGDHVTLSRWNDLENIYLIIGIATGQSRVPALTLIQLNKHQDITQCYHPSYVKKVQGPLVSSAAESHYK